jgi:AbrB family looped-hinge helix DNA binding protein
MKTKVARRHQITIPEEIRKKARISVGDILEISYKRGKVQVEKIDDNWDTVMKETKGAWRKHPVFKDMDSVEIVEWMRGKKERRLQRFLALNNIEVKYTSSKIAKRSGELYAKKLLKNKRSLNRILPDFIIGAHSELYSDALVTWNPSDFDLNKVVKSPVEIME